MSVAEIAVIILLGLAVTVELLCCLGLVLMRNTYDRLHFLGPAATLGPVLVAAAVLVRHATTQGSIKIVVLVGLVLVINPVLTHITARAVRIRETGRLEVQPDETEQGS